MNRVKPQIRWPEPRGTMHHALLRTVTRKAQAHDARLAGAAEPPCARGQRRRGQRGVAVLRHPRLTAGTWNGSCRNWRRRRPRSIRGPPARMRPGMMLRVEDLVEVRPCLRRVVLG